jgi:D-alanyl-D-alanine dipeptidase
MSILPPRFQVSPFLKNILFPVIMLQFALKNNAQNTSTVPSARILRDNAAYLARILSDSNLRMTELRSFIPGLIVDLKYAGPENFTGETLYRPGTEVTFLRLPVAKALRKVQAELNKQGLGLKIYDAYRPYSVTVRMWEKSKKKNYLANPAKGSDHNRGTAVDLTLVDLSTGRELIMPSGFDEFSRKANQDYAEGDPAALANREKLKKVMNKFGFRSNKYEWWHFSWPGGNGFELLDLSFETLKNLERQSQHI